MVDFFNLLLSIGGILAILIMILGLVWLATDYYTSYIKKKEVVTPTVQPSPPITLNVQTIQLTKELMLFIDRLIEFETFNTLTENVALGTSYDVRKLDKGVNDIATAVYEYLDSYIFTNTLYAIKKEKIMTYIVKQTRSFFISAVTNHNSRYGGMVQ